VDLPEPSIPSTTINFPLVSFFLTLAVPPLLILALTNLSCQLRDIRIIVYSTGFCDLAYIKKRAYRRLFLLGWESSDVPVFIIRGIQLKQLTRHDENDAFADIRHPVGCALKIMNDPEYLVGMVD